MATTTSVLPDLMDAIQTALDARSGLDGVTVLSGPADAEDLGREYVVLGLMNPPIALPQRWGAQTTRYKKEALAIRCELRANQPGKGETSIRAARDRAFAIFAEVETYIRETPTAGLSAIDVMQVEDVTFAQGADDQGRIAVIEFTITADTSLISS